MYYLCPHQIRNTMKIQVKIGYDKITISEPMIGDTYFIEQSNENDRFYITSNNGYNGYEGEGHATLERAIKLCRGYIKDYFKDRGEENPKGF